MKRQPLPPDHDLGIAKLHTDGSISLPNGLRMVDSSMTGLRFAQGEFDILSEPTGARIDVRFDNGNCEAFVHDGKAWWQEMASSSATVPTQSNSFVPSQANTAPTVANFEQLPPIYTDMNRRNETRGFFWRCRDFTVRGAGPNARDLACRTAECMAMMNLPNLSIGRAHWAKPKRGEIVLRVVQHIRRGMVGMDVAFRQQGTELFVVNTHYAAKWHLPVATGFIWMLAILVLLLCVPIAVLFPTEGGFVCPGIVGIALAYHACVMTRNRCCPLSNGDQNAIFGLKASVLMALDDAFLATGVSNKVKRIDYW